MDKQHGPDRERCLETRKQLLASDVHYVEIDLRRGGTRLPPGNLPESDYYALVSRAQQRSRIDVWPIRVRERLPMIPVPVRSEHADAILDLQAVLNGIYDDAGYAYHIYSGEPEPPLSRVDAAWARQFVPAPR